MTTQKTPKKSHLIRDFLGGINVNNYQKITYQYLQSAIQSVCQNREEHVYYPSADFTRKRKLPMSVVIESIIKFGAQSLNSELLEQWNYHVETPTASAFVQARAKLKPSAFKAVFDLFNQSFDKAKRFKGYQLLAHDGSDLPLPQNVKAHDNHFKRGNANGYNVIHVNFLYDLLNKQFLDVDFQNKRQTDERSSLCQMAQKIKPTQPVIFIGDRGYPSFNLFEHLQRLQHKYVIRCKDVNRKGFLRKSDVPDTDEFDTIVSLKLTYSRTKAIKDDPSFRFLSTTSKFDFLKRGSKDYYEIRFRVVRLKLSESTYECLITNLDDNFTPNDLKELYHLRWGIETSFRDLKHSVDLEYLHTKESSQIYQEIYARLITYNFTMRLVGQVKFPKKKRHWDYQVNVKMAFRLYRRYLNDMSIDIMRLISSYILPIREGRKFERLKFRRGFVGFHYR